MKIEYFRQPTREGVILPWRMNPFLKSKQSTFDCVLFLYNSWVVSLRTSCLSAFIFPYTNDDGSSGDSCQRSRRTPSPPSNIHSLFVYASVYSSFFQKLSWHPSSQIRSPFPTCCSSYTKLTLIFRCSKLDYLC